MHTEATPTSVEIQSGNAPDLNMQGAYRRQMSRMEEAHRNPYFWLINPEGQGFLSMAC